MRPYIWLSRGGKAWMQVANDAAGALDIFEIARRTSLRRESLTVNRIAASEGITIEMIRSIYGSEVGTSEESAARVDGDAELGTGFNFQAEDVVGGHSDGINGRRRSSYFTARSETIIQICELVNQKGALLIRGPTGSGKTSILQLVAHVNNFQGMFKQVHYISLAQIGDKTFEDFLNCEYRGVPISKLQSPESSPDKHPKSDSKSKPTLLLIDRAQVAFGRDLTLWRTIKDCMGGSLKHLRIIIVLTWNSAIISHGGQRVATPMEFKSDATIGLLPSAMNSISLKLTRDEAMDLWNSWCKKGLGFRDEPSSWNDLRDYVFRLTGEQPGLMAHVLDFLIEQGLKNSEAGSVKQMQEAQRLLLSRGFVGSLSKIRSLRTIVQALRGWIPEIASMRSLLRKLLSTEGVGLEDLSGGDRKAAEFAVKGGQILEDNGWLSLPSELHRQFLLREVYWTNDSTSESIKDNGLHAFIVRVIERFNPLQLKSSKARNASGNVVFQNEFYRAACSILPTDSIMSPNVGPLFGVHGFLDYYLLPHRWGFELLVDGSELEEPKARFERSGVYHKLIKDAVVSEYQILDFRTKRLDGARPGVLHVVFSEDFKKATLHRCESPSESLDVKGIPLEN